MKKQYHLLLLQPEQMYIFTFLQHLNILKLQMYLNNFMEKKIIIPFSCMKVWGTEELKDLSLNKNLLVAKRCR